MLVRKCMKTHINTRVQGHCLTFRQGHPDSQFEASPKLLNFHMESAWIENNEVCTNNCFAAGHIATQVSDGCPLGRHVLILNKCV